MFPRLRVGLVLATQWKYKPDAQAREALRVTAAISISAGLATEGTEITENLP